MIVDSLENCGSLNQYKCTSIFRSKIECGMGTVPIGQKVHLQTWDGVMSGDRLLTMACSDKILRWNVVGIQV